ncbi:MAG: hypothetical protein ACSLEL_04835 [Candidatus Malihini olakiniferum]
MKTDESGIADIAFIMQYLVLYHMAQKLRLANQSNKLRIETDGSVRRDERGRNQALTLACITLRNELHHLACRTFS